ncbi:MAG: MotA/TolQ/ExbB proton channel family protein, partial [Bacteroidetes bacterium]
MFSLSNLTVSGGITIFVLFIASVLSWIVIIERWIYFQARRIDPGAVLDKVLSGTELSEAEAKSPAGYVLSECLEGCPHPSGPEDPLYDEVKARALAESLIEMERYLNIEATLGTVSPYIGLLGTVFGIIQAFTHLGGGTGASPETMSGLNAGIAHALIATAGGLI